MKTQELKSYIDRVLGNSIRCLLPSYWWKRLFGMVVDKVEDVEQSTSKLIDSKVEEVKMPIVESVDELSKLNLPKGGVAAVEKVGEPVVVNLEDCYLSADAATDWDKYTVIRGFSEKGAPSNAVGQIHLYSDKSMENGLTIACGEGKYLYYKIVNGRRYDSSLEEVNKYLASGEYRLVFGYYIENVSAYVTLYSAFPQPSLYIKGDSWEKLSKEYAVSSEEELNTLSVENGTIAKVARELKQINRANCHTVIKFSDIPANWDKFTRVDKVEHIGGNTSNSCGINLAHYDGHAYVVLRINFVGHMTYVASVYVDSTLTNEESITKAEVDVKLKEYDFRYIGPTFTSGEPYIDSTFILYEKDISVDAYIKGETWERLAKESDLVENEGDNVVIIYANEESTRNTNAFNTIIDCYENEKPYVAVVKIDEMLYSANITIQKVNDRYGIMAQCINTAYNKVYGVLFGLSVETGVGLANLLTESELITIDSELSDTSENPVQNKVVTEALGILEEHLAVHSNQISSLGLSMATKTDVDNAIANAITTTLNTAV